MRKSLIPVAIILSTILAFPVQAAEWKQDEKGWYYQKDDGSRLVNQWFVDPTDESTYHFDTFGYMNTGKCYINGAWYYFNENGQVWYNYESPDGFLVTDEGKIVYSDTPGLTVGVCNMLNVSTDEDKFFFGANIKNFRNVPLTLMGYATMTGSGFFAEFVGFDNERMDVMPSVTIQPNSTYTLVFVTPDLHPVNMIPDESRITLNFECEGEEYETTSTLIRMTENNPGSIIHVDP